MGQGIACAHRLSDGVFIYGSNYHPEIMKAWNHQSKNGDRSGWVCSETRLNIGPGKYTIGNYGYFHDSILGEKCRKQAIAFFETHTASVEAVTRYLRTNHKYCGTHLQEELLYLLSSSGQSIFHSMKEILIGRAEKRWSAEGKRFDRQIKKTARDMELAIKGLIISINKQIINKEYHVPLTSDTVAIRDALYLAATKKVIKHKVISEFEASMKALISYFDDILKRVYQEKGESKRNAGGEDTFLSELALFEKLLSANDLRDRKWQSARYGCSFRDMNTYPLTLLLADGTKTKLTGGWRIVDKHDRCFLFANKTDENSISINSNAVAYRIGEDGYGYPTLDFRHKR